MLTIYSFNLFYESENLFAKAKITALLQKTDSFSHDIISNTVAMECSRTLAHEGG